MNKEMIIKAAEDELVNEYHCTITHPYNDGYREYTYQGHVIGGVNPDGYNAGACIMQVAEVFKKICYQLVQSSV